MRSDEVRGEADAIQPPASHPFSTKVEEAEINGGEEDQRGTKICSEANTSTPTKEHGMRRANTFTLAPTRAQDAELRRLATSCAKLWNEVNYQRRKAYSNHQPIDWNSQLYKKYGPSISAATAQQIVRKHSEAWRSFLALKRLERQGKLPPHIKKVSPPGYWKRGGKYELVVLCRNDRYRIDGDALRLPKGMLVGFKGNLKWSGKQGRLEIRYDQLARKWRVFQPVVVKTALSPKGSKMCHIDLGVRNLGTVLVEGRSRPIAFNAGNLLADWWYWTRRIAAHQARLWRVNKRETSKTLKRLYRKRQRRFKHAVNAFARKLVQDLHDLGVSEIVLGDLNRIRLNGEDHSRQTNAMIHNFWSHRDLVDRIRWTAEEHGIAVVDVSEAHTSDTCPRCRSRKSEGRKRLFRCLRCGLEAHRDAVGVANMASLHGERAVRAVVSPLLLRWDGCRWKGKSPMPTEEDEPMRSKNLPTKLGRAPNGLLRHQHYGRFYSAKEAFARLREAAKRFGVGKLRISGAEPTLGRKHLLALLECVERSEFSTFVLETNGILFGADQGYVRALAGFKKPHVRISLKAGTPEAFARKTGAKPESFELPFKAIRNLLDHGVSFHVAAMSADPRIMTWEERESLIERLMGIEPSLAWNLEEEVVDPYDTALARLRYAGLELEWPLREVYPPIRRPRSLGFREGCLAYRT